MADENSDTQNEEIVSPPTGQDNAAEVDAEQAEKEARVAKRREMRKKRKESK